MESIPLADTSITLASFREMMKQRDAEAKRTEPSVLLTIQD